MLSIASGGRGGLYAGRTRSLLPARAPPPPLVFLALHLTSPIQLAFTEEAKARTSGEPGGRSWWAARQLPPTPSRARESHDRALPGFAELAATHLVKKRVHGLRSTERAQPAIIRKPAKRGQPMLAATPTAFSLFGRQFPGRTSPRRRPRLLRDLAGPGRRGVLRRSARWRGPGLVCCSGPPPDRGDLAACPRTGARRREGAAPAAAGSAKGTRPNLRRAQARFETDENIYEAGARAGLQATRWHRALEYLPDEPATAASHDAAPAVHQASLAVPARTLLIQRQCLQDGVAERTG